VLTVLPLANALGIQDHLGSTAMKTFIPPPQTP